MMPSSNGSQSTRRIATRRQRRISQSARLVTRKSRRISKPGRHMRRRSTFSRGGLAALTSSVSFRARAMTTALQEKRLADARAAEAATAAAAEARAAKALAKSHSAQSFRILELKESTRAVEEYKAREKAFHTIATKRAVAEAKRAHEMKQRKVDASLRRTKVHTLVLKKTHRKARHAKAKAVLARASAQAAEAASVCSRKAQEARKRREYAAEEAQVSLKALKAAESTARKAELEGEEARANFKRARERFGSGISMTAEQKHKLELARLRHEMRAAQIEEANRLARAARLDANWSKNEANKREAEEAKAEVEAANAEAMAQHKAHLSAMVDGDGDGKLDATELLELLKTLDGFDDDGDGQIDERILARFRVLADADGDGCVRVDEVLHLIDADDDGNVDDMRSLAERCEIEAREERELLASSMAACVKSAEKKSEDSTAKARAAAARHREAALQAAEMSDATAAAERAVARAEETAAEAKAKKAFLYRLQAERFEKERAAAREAARVAMAEAERRRVLSTRVDPNGDGELDETEVCALLEMFGIVDAVALHGQGDAKALANRLLMMLGLESINDGGSVGVAEMLALIDADGDGKVDGDLGSRLSQSLTKPFLSPTPVPQAEKEEDEEAISNVTNCLHRSDVGRVEVDDEDGSCADELSDDEEDMDTEESFNVEEALEEITGERFRDRLKVEKTRREDLEVELAMAVNEMSQLRKEKKRAQNHILEMTVLLAASGRDAKNEEKIATTSNRGGKVPFAFPPMGEAQEDEGITSSNQEKEVLFALRSRRNRTVRTESARSVAWPRQRRLMSYSRQTNLPPPGELTQVRPKSCSSRSYPFPLSSSEIATWHELGDEDKEMQDQDKEEEEAQKLEKAPAEPLSAFKVAEQVETCKEDVVVEQQQVEEAYHLPVDEGMSIIWHEADVMHVHAPKLFNRIADAVHFLDATVKAVKNDGSDTAAPPVCEAFLYPRESLVDRLEDLAISIRTQRNEHDEDEEASPAAMHHSVASLRVANMPSLAHLAGSQDEATSTLLEDALDPPAKGGANTTSTTQQDSLGMVGLLTKLETLDKVLSAAGTVDIKTESFASPGVAETDRQAVSDRRQSLDDDLESMAAAVIQQIAAAALTGDTPTPNNDADAQGKSGACDIVKEKLMDALSKPRAVPKRRMSTLFRVLQAWRREQANRDEKKNSGISTGPVAMMRLIKSLAQCIGISQVPDGFEEEFEEDNDDNDDDDNLINFPTLGPRRQRRELQMKTKDSAALVAVRAAATILILPRNVHSITRDPDLKKRTSLERLSLLDAACDAVGSTLQGIARSSITQANSRGFAAIQKYTTQEARSLLHSEEEISLHWALAPLNVVKRSLRRETMRVKGCAPGSTKAVGKTEDLLVAVCKAATRLHRAVAKAKSASTKGLSEEALENKREGDLLHGDRDKLMDAIVSILDVCTAASVTTANKSSDTGSGSVGSAATCSFRKKEIQRKMHDAAQRGFAGAMRALRDVVHDASSTPASASASDSENRAALKNLFAPAGVTQAFQAVTGIIKAALRINALDAGPKISTEHASLLAPLLLSTETEPRLSNSIVQEGIHALNDIVALGSMSLFLVPIPPPFVGFGLGALHRAFGAGSKKSSVEGSRRQEKDHATPWQVPTILSPTSLLSTLVSLHDKLDNDNILGETKLARKSRMDLADDVRGCVVNMALQHPPFPGMDDDMSRQAKLSLLQRDAHGRLATPLAVMTKMAAAEIKAHATPQVINNHHNLHAIYVRGEAIRNFWRHTHRRREADHIIAERHPKEPTRRKSPILKRTVKLKKRKRKSKSKSKKKGQSRGKSKKKEDEKKPTPTPTPWLRQLTVVQMKSLVAAAEALTLQVGEKSPDAMRFGIRDGDSDSARSCCVDAEAALAHLDRAAAVQDTFRAVGALDKGERGPEDPSWTPRERLHCQFDAIVAVMGTLKAMRRDFESKAPSIEDVEAQAVRSRLHSMDVALRDDFTHLVLATAEAEEQEEELQAELQAELKAEEEENAASSAEMLRVLGPMNLETSRKVDTSRKDPSPPPIPAPRTSLPSTTTTCGASSSPRTPSSYLPTLATASSSSLMRSKSPLSFGIRPSSARHKWSEAADLESRTSTSIRWSLPQQEHRQQLLQDTLPNKKRQNKSMLKKKGSEATARWTRRISCYPSSRDLDENPILSERFAWAPAPVPVPSPPSSSPTPPLSTLDTLRKRRNRYLPSSSTCTHPCSLTAAARVEVPSKSKGDTPSRSFQRLGDMARRASRAALLASEDNDFTKTSKRGARHQRKKSLRKEGGPSGMLLLWRIFTYYTIKYDPSTVEHLPLRGFMAFLVDSGLVFASPTKRAEGELLYTATVKQTTTVSAFTARARFLLHGSVSPTGRERGGSRLMSSSSSSSNSSGPAIFLSHLSAGAFRGGLMTFTAFLNALMTLATKHYNDTDVERAFETFLARDIFPDNKAKRRIPIGTHLTARRLAWLPARVLIPHALRVFSGDGTSGSHGQGQVSEVAAVLRLYGPALHEMFILAAERTSKWYVQSDIFSSDEDPTHGLRMATWTTTEVGAHAAAAPASGATTTTLSFHGTLALAYDLGLVEVTSVRTVADAYLTAVERGRGAVVPLRWETFLEMLMEIALAGAVICAEALDESHVTTSRTATTMGPELLAVASPLRWLMSYVGLRLDQRFPKESFRTRPGGVGGVVGHPTASRAVRSFIAAFWSDEGASKGLA